MNLNALKLASSIFEKKLKELKSNECGLGVVFNHFLFSPLLGEDSHFD